MPPSEPSPFEIDPEEMRRLGYDVVDRIVNHLQSVGDGPAWTMMSREDGEARLREDLPEQGAAIEPLLDTLEKDVLAYRARVGHPRFFAFVPGAPTFPGVLGDMLTAGHNPFVGTWLGGSGPAMLELVVIDWFARMLGLDRGTGGLLTSGGSAANLIALFAAREARIGADLSRAIVYASDQTHACVERAARMIGIPSANYRKLATGPDYRLDPAALAAAIAVDRRGGLTPFFVVANGGTTNTGSVDPLEELAGVCRRENLWLHVDAAYGGFAVLDPRGKRVLAGLERADSWVVDPHKWLYQGFECGSVLFRRPEELREAFKILPDYMQDVDAGGERLNFADYGFQLTRSARAIKVWLSIKYHGLAAFRQAVGRSLDLAAEAEALIRNSVDFELLSPAELSIVCFRLVRPGLDAAGREALNAHAQAQVNESGYALLSSSRLKGEYTLRICILSDATTSADVAGVLDRLLAAGRTWTPEAG